MSSFISKHIANILIQQINVSRKKWTKSSGDMMLYFYKIIKYYFKCMTVQNTNAN